jgi:hypothetical protein
MRAPRSSLSPRLLPLTLAAIAIVAACDTNKHADPKFMAAPKSFDPKGAELTFNAKGLEAFNSMSSDEREAHLEKLRTTPGSLTGQALFERDEELTDKIDDRVHGKFVVWATVPDPVWLEVQMEYQLFSEQQLFTGAAPKTHIAFTGTLIDVVYQDSSKPRKIEIKLKADSITALKD